MMLDPGCNAQHQEVEKDEYLINDSNKVLFCPRLHYISSLKNLITLRKWYKGDFLWMFAKAMT